MTYKEYVKKQFDEALERGFDPEGSSTTAVCSRGFFKQMLYNVEGVNEPFIEVIQSWKVLVMAIVGLLVIVAAPITYPLALITSVFFVKRRAKKEMMKYYISSKVDKLHK